MPDEIRIIATPMMGITAAATHVFIYNYDLEEGRGSSRGGGTGVRSLAAPRVKVNITRGQYYKIKNYPGWNKGLYIPFINDCHSQLQGAFRYAGADYPKDTRLERIQPRRLFAGHSYNSLFRHITATLFTIPKSKIVQMNTEVASIIMRDAKSDHKYRNRTGRLTNSLQARRIGNNVQIGYTADYAESVLRRTNDPVLTRAVTNNISTIQSIRKKYMDVAIEENRRAVDIMIEDLGTQIMYDQMEDITRER